MNPVIDPRGATTVAPLNGSGRPGAGKHWFWSVDWDVVGQSIKPIFEDMIGRVKSKRPSTKGKIGRSSGTGVPFVYSYCTFDDPLDQAIDPVVAGITFTPSGDDVTIKADIGGESSGKDWFECPERMVPNSLPEIMIAATELAITLSTQADVICEALREPCFPLDD